MDPVAVEQLRTLAELDARHDDVLRELDELDRRVVDVLAQYAPLAARVAPAASPRPVGAEEAAESLPTAERRVA